MNLLFLILAALTLGQCLCKGLRVESRIERWTLQALSGLAVCAVLTLATGMYSLSLSGLTLAAVGVFGTGWRLVSARIATPGLGIPHWKKSFSTDDFFGLEKIAAGVLLAALAMTGLGILAPITSWDATVAHLALPASYAREGHIAVDPGNVYSGYPQFMHGLYALVYASGAERAAAALSWVMALLACGAAYALGRRLGGRRCGLLTAALLATAPIYADQAGTVSIDLAFAAYATIALVRLLDWMDTHPRRLPLDAALLAGAGCGIRHTGYLIAGLLFIAVLACARERRMHTATLFACMTALGTAPWLLYSIHATGSPVFPLLLGVFPPRGIEHIAVTGAATHGSVVRSGGLGLWGLLRFPWDIIMHPGHYDGWTKSPGLLVLFLGVPGLLMGGRRCRWLGAYSGAGLTAFYLFQRLARYLLPFFVPMMAVAALVEQRLSRPARMLAAVLLMASFAVGLGVHSAAIHFKIRAALGMEPRDTYLARRVERYLAFQYVEDQLPRDGAVLSLDQRTYFMQGHKTFQNHWALKRIATDSPEKQLAWLRAQGIRYVLYPKDFVRDSGAIAHDVGPMLDAWEKDAAHFAIVIALQTPGLRGAPPEQVDILEVRHE